jgi:hypothetical protein
LSELFDNKKQSNSNFRKSLQERIEKANPRRKLTTEEIRRQTLFVRCEIVFAPPLWYQDITVTLDGLLGNGKNCRVAKSFDKRFSQFELFGKIG